MEGLLAAFAFAISPGHFNCPMPSNYSTARRFRGLIGFYGLRYVTGFREV